MRRILEDLWYGRISLDRSDIRPSREAKERMERMSNDRNALENALTEEQMAIVERYHDAYTDLVCQNECEIFQYAFRLGAKILIEILCDTDE